MSDLMHEDVIGNTMEANIGKFFDTGAATGRLSKKILTKTSFIAPVDTSV